HLSSFLFQPLNSSKIHPKVGKMSENEPLSKYTVSSTISVNVLPLNISSLQLLPIETLHTTSCTMFNAISLRSATGVDDKVRTKSSTSASNTFLNNRVLFA